MTLMQKYREIRLHELLVRDATASAYAIQSEKINEANTHRGRLQDMLKRFAKDVDITALFLWNTMVFS